MYIQKKKRETIYLNADKNEIKATKIQEIVCC